MYFTVFEENICWSIYLLRVVWFCLLHVSFVVTAFSRDQGNLIRNGCTKGICDCGSFRSHAWICDGNVAGTSVYGVAGNRNKSCTYLINSLTICYNVFFYLIRILSWYKFIASSANEALRVEFSTSSNFTWSWGSAQTPGQAEPVFTRPLVLRFRLRAARLLIASRFDSPPSGAQT